MGAIKTCQGFLLKIMLTALTVLIAPATLAFAAVSLLLLRPVVALLARILRSDLADIMYNRGQVFAFEPVYTKSSLTVLMHLVCDGTVSLESLREQFRRQLLPSVWNKNKGDDYVRLRQLWTQYCGYLFWQWEADFRVEKHVREYDYEEPELALPKGGVCSEEHLKGITGAISERAYSPGQSPWEMLLIKNYKSSNNTDGHPQCVIVLRMHHTLTDIISMIKLILRLFDQETVSFAKARFRQTSAVERLWRNVKVALRAPYDVASNLVDVHDGKNCWSMENKQLTKHYHTLFSNPVPVGKIKEIMKKYGVSYNAAIYSVTGGAMVKLMTEAGQKVPDQLSTFMPYPLPDHPGGLVNHWSTETFTFRPAIHSTPRQRLKAISRSVVPASVFTAMPLINDWILSLMLLLPPKLLVFLYGLAHVTLGMTNVPGPDAQLDVLGTAKLVEIIPLMGHPMLTVGAIAMMVSAGGKQRIGLAIQRVNFEGHNLPSNFPRYVDEEIEQLLA